MIDALPTLLALDDPEMVTRRIGYVRRCTALLPAGEPAAVHYPPAEANSSTVRVPCEAPTTHVRLVTTGSHTQWRSVCTAHTQGPLA